MRATFILAAALACATLAGCDQTPDATPPAAPPPPQAAVLPPAPPAPVTTPDAPARHRYRHHHYASENYSSSEYAGSDSYGYVSDSHTSGDSASADSTQRGGRLWIDGFGRAYHADHGARVAGTMQGKRLAAWAHYDEKCPDR